MDHIEPVDATTTHRNGIHHHHVINGVALDNDPTKSPVNGSTIIRDGASPPPMDAVSVIQFIVQIIAALYWFVSTVFVYPFVCTVYYGLLLKPLSLISRNAYISIENQLCRWTNHHWAASFAWYGLRVTESGDDVSKYSEERCILMANHLGLVDHFVLMAALNNKGTMSGRWIWIIFHLWQFTPLGLMWSLHGNFFINGDRREREKRLEVLRRHLLKVYWRDDFRWLVVYPEGTRLFLIRDSNREYAQKNNLPQLNHCALPRTGAIYAMTSTTTAASVPPQDRVQYIVDATIGYPRQHAPTVNEVLSCEYQSEYGGEMSVHYRVYPMCDIPHDNEQQLSQWLNERWVEKDLLLDLFYSIDHKITIIADAFYWTSAYIFWRYMMAPVLTTIVSGLLSGVAYY